MDGAVSIGRNIDTEPMPDRQWQSFIRTVRDAIAAEGGAVYATNTGQGYWNGGGYEENAVITFTIPNAHKLGRLRWRLGQIARTYQQDAIALLAGETTLVGAA
jgi:hypothetical protein